MYALLLELTALLAFWLCLGAWQEDGVAAGRRAFVALSLAVFAWSVGVLARLEGLATLEQQHRIALLGAIPVPGLWLSLALQASNHPWTRFRRWLPSAIMLPQGLLYLTLFTGFAPGFFLSAVDGRTVLGLGGWLNAGYSWLLGVAGSWLFLVGSRRLRAQRVPRLLVCLASVAPVLASIVTLLVPDMEATDPTPILLGAALLPLRYALFSGGWLHVLAVPEHQIVSHIPRPLVFTDPQGVVKALNPAARQLLRIEPLDAVGRSLDAVMAELAPRGSTTRWPIQVDDKLAGHAVLLRLEPTRSET